MNSQISPEATIEDIEAQEKLHAAAAAERMEFAKLVFEVMEASPRGPELLQALYGVTQGAPLMQVTGSLVEGEVALSPSDWAYLREGQNSVIRFLLSQIEYAKNPPIELQQKEKANE